MINIDIHFSWSDISYVLPNISRNMGDSPTYITFFGNFP
jgi:hypothetical protein